MSGNCSVLNGSTLAPDETAGGKQDALLKGLSREIALAAAGVAGLVQALGDERVCEPLGSRQERAVRGLRHAGRRLLALAEDLTDTTAQERSPLSRPARVDPVLALHGARERLAERLHDARVRVVGPGSASGLGALVPPDGLDGLLDGVLAATSSMVGEDGVVVVEVRKADQVQIRVRMVSATLTEEALHDAMSPGGELGLARRRSRRMGGDLTLRADGRLCPGLILHLPATYGPGGEAVVLPAFEPVGGSALLIGFAPADRALMRLIADAVGLSALYMAQDEADGLRMTNELDPDVVIVDLSKPRIDADTFARSLDREDHGRRAKRLAVASSAPSSAERRSLRRWGYRHVLAHPLDLEDVAHALKSAVCA